MRTAQSRRLYPPSWSYPAFILWLECGYAVALRLTTGLPWTTSTWQAAICLAAIGPLLLAVMNVVAGPKVLGRLPAAAFHVLRHVGGLGEFAIPWLGWAALIRVMNAGDLRWIAAFRSAGAIAVFSYLTGAALLLRFRPTAADVEVTEVTIDLPNLPRSFDGYRILHISDIHCRTLLPAQRVAERLLPAGSLHPDLIVFTGDLSDESPLRLETAAEALSALTAPDGIVAVMGNHDIWSGEARFVKAMAHHGIKLLVNDHLTLSRDGAQLHIAGVNDASYTEKADLAAALNGVPDGSKVILLSHAPAIMRDPLAQRASLVLSGHTHGGQVVLPGIGPIYVPSRLGRRYSSGLFRIGQTQLFITRGLGEVVPPLRINCPPEMAVLTLRAGGEVCAPSFINSRMHPSASAATPKGVPPKVR